MLIKAGVSIERLERHTRRGLGITNWVFERCDEELIITSTFEGNHGAGSLHYANQAFDIRHTQNKTCCVAEILERELGEDFDVVEELDHIHIEYDPK